MDYCPFFRGPASEGLELKFHPKSRFLSWVWSLSFSRRYHVARQRGTIAETSRMKANAFITALLVNVGCWLGTGQLSGHRSKLTSSVVASSDRGRCLVKAMALR